MKISRASNTYEHPINIFLGFLDLVCGLTPGCFVTPLNKCYTCAIKVISVYAKVSRCELGVVIKIILTSSVKGSLNSD